MKIQIVTLLLFFQHSIGFEIIETSNYVQFLQHTSDSIFCQADSMIDNCNWKQDSIGVRSTTNTPLGRIDILNGRCTLTFDNITWNNFLNDRGPFQCVLQKGDEIQEGLYIHGNFEILFLLQFHYQ